MRRVKNLIQELQKFPGDAMVYAYEGEFQGLEIIWPQDHPETPGEEVGYIDVAETVPEETHPAVINKR